ncbi:hypothetical protein LPJ75_003974, partial [Coemansia sp. RSA 2598]
MIASSAALFYGRAQRDQGHVQWFAVAAFIDVLVYAAGIAYGAELRMTDVEQCAVAMAANPGLTVEHCLEHVHEIKAIAYAMRLAALAAKAYLAAVARSYELRCGFGAHDQQEPAGNLQIRRAPAAKPVSTDAPVSLLFRRRLCYAHRMNPDSRQQPATPERAQPLRRADAASVPFPTPQPLAARNASMMGLPGSSPEAHRHNVLQRAHSLQSPSLPSQAPRQSQTPHPHSSHSQNIHQLGAYSLAPEILHHGYSPFAGSPPSSLRFQQFSPRRKRLSASEASATTPRRIRRRLFFEDDADSPLAHESAEHRQARSKEAAAAALSIIREAVEVGEPHIDLSDLGLEAVPDELAELKDLVVLTPGHILATDLQLTLSSNRLAYFPLAVCELANLTTLIISNNRIAHLPPEIGNLTALKELSIAHNRLHTLPLELMRLTELHTLTVFPNPFAEAPPDSHPTSHPLRADTYPHALRLENAGVPRLSDLAARRLTRQQLAALKHRLSQCLGTTQLDLGRIIGPAVEPEDGGVLQALRAQHLAVPVGHQCAGCGQWFLAPAAE